MNQEQTIALWQRCEDARAAALAEGQDEDEAHEAATAIWNGWANELLARKPDMEESGTWAARKNWIGNLEAKIADTRRWMDEAKADFSGLGFLTRALADADETQAGEDAQQKLGSSSGAVKSLLLKTDVARFDGWTFPGDAWFREAQFSGDAGFGEAQFSTYTDFSRTQFSSEAEFIGARFSGETGFEVAQFSGDVEFGGARFSGDANFQRAQFLGAARFGIAQFSNAAKFDEALFSGDARFWGVEFLGSGGEARFSQAQFKGYTTFDDTVFRSGANFDAIRSDSTFDLAGASFEALPGFIQANFKEPPRFDHLTLKTPLASSEPKERLADAWRICARQWRERRADLSSEAKANARDTTSKFRALKALAIKAHDGEREHLFHKGELRGRRLSEDEGGAVFLGNIAYDLLADFGRSFLRPLAVWAGLAFGVAGLYWVSFLLTPARDGCGWLSAFGHSLYLATRSGLVLLGRARDQRLTDAYLCLFGPRTVSAGVPPDPPHPPAAPIRIPIPDIPGWVTFAEMAHTLISVILIFLIALALRNQFKIK